MKNKKLWAYSGPFSVDGRIDYCVLETFAVSKKQAANNFLAQLKRAHNRKLNDKNLKLLGKDECYSCLEEINHNGTEYSEEYGKKMIRTDGGYLEDPDQ